MFIVLYILKKSQHVSGPTQFKPMLVKGQNCVLICIFSFLSFCKLDVGISEYAFHIT